MTELDLNEIAEVAGGSGTCMCTRRATWYRCPSEKRCDSWCSGYGTMKFLPDPVIRTR